MTPAKTAAAAAILTLAACQNAGTASTDAPVPGPIATAEAFDAAVVGRTLTIGDSSLVIAADGTMSGTFNTAPLRGTWTFADGLWCRTLTEHSTRAPTDQCQTFVLNPDGTLSVTAQDGRAFIYTVG